MGRNNSKLELSSIVDLSLLEAVRDVFSEETGLATAILDEEARPIIFERYLCPFCKEVRKTTAGVTLCRASDRRGIELAREEKGPVFYYCNQGLVEFCTPITVNGEFIAFLFSGQLRCAEGEYKTSVRPSLEKLSKMADKTKEKVDVDTVELERKFQEVEVFDQSKFKWAKNTLERLAGQLNSVVNKLNEWKRGKIVDDFMKEASKVQTVEKLFDLIIKSLPGMMGAIHCSIFTIQKDEKDRERLVLRKTSYLKLKPQENSAYYEKGEGLTGWVWKHSRPLRLINLKDPAELAQYGDLEWKQKYNDSDEHTSFICVPMFGRKGQVIGVIRVPHKIEDLPFFKHDEIFLNFLARHLSWAMEYQSVEDKLKHAIPFTNANEIFLNFLRRHLSWAMEYQPAEDKFKRAVGNIALVDAATEITSAQTYNEVLDATIRSSLDLFGTTGKKHFVNILGPDKEHWKIERIGGRLGLTDLRVEWEGQSFHISQGITGKAIRKRHTCISLDLKASMQKSEYINAAEGAESVISAPIRCREDIYGAISIASDKPNLSEEELILLESLAKLAGAAIRKVAEGEGAGAEITGKRKHIGQKTWDFILVHILPEFIKKALGLS